MQFLDLSYKKKDLDFQKKKFKERSLYQISDICKNRKVSLEIKLPQKNLSNDYFVRLTNISGLGRLELFGSYILTT